MAIIKVKIKCPNCGYETEKKENDKDSRGYIEVPDRYCNKCKILMVQKFNNSNKNPDGE